MALESIGWEPYTGCLSPRSPLSVGWVMGWYLGPRWLVSFLQGDFSSYRRSLCASSSLLTAGQQAGPSVGTGGIVFCSQMIAYILTIPNLTFNIIDTALKIISEFHIIL